jgi:hypothetical protein
MDYSDRCFLFGILRIKWITAIIVFSLEYSGSIEIKRPKRNKCRQCTVCFDYHLIKVNYFVRNVGIKSVNIMRIYLSILSLRIKITERVSIKFVVGRGGGLH